MDVFYRYVFFVYFFLFLKRKINEKPAKLKTNA